MAEPEVLARFDDGGGLGTLTLNRASKLNALNLNMIRLLHLAVDDVERRAGRLSCIIMDGAGGKAFCAGGDVAEVREQAMAGGSLPADFFYEEYAIVHRLATLRQRTGCCQVSIWDGITMGGGVGLSSHGPFRVATERTVFAKPEMAIGFFPDVGSTHKLGRLKLGFSVGLYVGITGSRLTAWDCLRAGLATHFVPSASVPKLRELLVRKCTPGLTGDAAAAACEEALREAAAGAEPSPTGAVLTDENVAVIDRCFGAPTLEEIVARLRAEPGDFAAATLRTMEASCSPTSCKVTLKAMRDFSKEGTTIGHALQIEYRLSQRFTTRPQPESDFYEGIRAVLVDKDRKQRWQPGWSELSQVSDEKVAFFFSPLEPGHRRGELLLDDPKLWSEAGRKPFPAPIVRSKL
mmetsp:Transcript_78472/g.233786  ORF Transcript_78472/g.233786 Transcript_78472/m.233786 type:complete len:406 (+) Transcript_78472:46-1263(+)